MLPLSNEFHGMLHSLELAASIERTEKSISKKDQNFINFSGVESHSSNDSFNISFFRIGIKTVKKHIAFFPSKFRVEKFLVYIFSLSFLFKQIMGSLA